MAMLEQMKVIEGWGKMCRSRFVVPVIARCDIYLPNDRIGQRLIDSINEPVVENTAS